MSVFEKHGKEIALYEKPSGVTRGRLLFAMAILSDCTEMLGEGDVSMELAEVKELLQSVILADAKVFSNLWACREIVLDGEAEYGCEFFVRASSLEAAETEAWECVKRNWIYDSPDEERPYTDFYKKEERWMESPGDYRGFRAEVVRSIETLADLSHLLNLPD